MKKLSRISIALAVLIIFIWILLPLALLRFNQSPGLPKDNCSVDNLLLELSDFPLGTEMSSSSDFEDLALTSASRAFLNLPKNIEVYQLAEYYNTPFLAWSYYLYFHRSLTSHNPYNGPWTKPSAILYSSQKAQQYDIACSENTYSGYRCMVMARYGRYFVFMRVNSVHGSIDRIVQEVLPKIDSLAIPCLKK